MFSFCCPCFLLIFLHYSMFLTAPMFQQSPPGAAAPWVCPCPSMGCPWAGCSPEGCPCSGVGPLSTTLPQGYPYSGVDCPWATISLGVSLPWAGASAHQRYLLWHWAPTSKSTSTVIFPTLSCSMCLLHFSSFALSPHFSEQVSLHISSCVSSPHGCTCSWTLLNSNAWCSLDWLQCWCPPPVLVLNYPVLSVFPPSVQKVWGLLHPQSFVALCRTLSS